MRKKSQKHRFALKVAKLPDGGGRYLRGEFFRTTARHLISLADQVANQSMLQNDGFRSLIDLSPTQPQKEIPTPLPTLVGGVEGNERSLFVGFQEY